MFKDLSDKLRNLTGLAKEAKMHTEYGNHMDEQARLFRLLSDLDKVNVTIGHVQYMVNYFDNAYRNTKFVQDFTNNHQAMLLSLQHLNELRAQRDELEGHIAYLRTVV